MMAGLITLILIVEPVFNEEFQYRLDAFFGIKHTLPKVVTSASLNQTVANYQQAANQQDGNTPQTSLGSILSGGSDVIVPDSTDFGIVIEKINANAKVIAQVNPANETEYMKALSQGVAQAKGTVYPGQKGNIYLFAHSTDAPWNVVRYNAVFFLLGELDPGDRIIMFYQGRRYDYKVFDKTVVPPSDTEFLTDTYNQSVLTLQTCYPPGTLADRLIVRAKLASD